MKHTGFVLIIMLCSIGSYAQTSMPAQSDSYPMIAVKAKPYQLLGSEQKTPVLSLYCIHKGKTTAHVLTFSPQGAITEDEPVDPKKDRVHLQVSLDKDQLSTVWIPYGDVITYAYYGKTEPERMQFIEQLLNPNASTLSISFTPFLTGTAVTSVFDLGDLRDQVSKHPDCQLK